VNQLSGTRIRIWHQFRVLEKLHYAPTGTRASINLQPIGSAGKPRHNADVSGEH
jgi:hypothetical protein